MKLAIRILSGFGFLCTLAASTSSASSLLCQSGPVTLTGNQNTQSMYTCAIPANAVPTGKSIRVTVNLASPSQMLSEIILNGTTLTDEQPPAGGQTWDFVIVNTGGTTGSLSGIRPGSAQNTLGPLGFQSVSPAILPWTSGWTLKIGVIASVGIKEEGSSFTVEILN